MQCLFLHLGSQLFGQEGGKVKFLPHLNFQKDLVYSLFVVKWSLLYFQVVPQSLWRNSVPPPAMPLVYTVHCKYIYQANSYPHYVWKHSSCTICTRVHPQFRINQPVHKLDLLLFVMNSLSDSYWCLDRMNIKSSYTWWPSDNMSQDSCGLPNPLTCEQLYGDNQLLITHSSLQTVLDKLFFFSFFCIRLCWYMHAVYNNMIVGNTYLPHSDEVVCATPAKIASLILQNVLSPVYTITQLFKTSSYMRMTMSMTKCMIV